MPKPPGNLASRLEARLTAHGDAGRAVQAKRYLKSDLEFLGVGMGPLRRAVGALTKECGPFERDVLVELVDELWRLPLFERRMAAVVLLERNTAALGPADLPQLDRLIRDAHTWALVDGLATKVLGDLTIRFRKVRVALDRWAVDDDLWIRRSSLLAEMRSLKEGGPFEPFATRADRMLDEKEFFIRKAIGWVLRETSKSRPEEVYEWLLPRAARASGVTMSEAIKYLPSEQSEELAAARSTPR